MNPALAATGAAGPAAALVVCLNAVIAYFVHAEPSAAVVASEVTLFTFAAGVALHYLTRVSPDVAAVVAADPAVKP